MDTTYERKLREMARLAIARGVALQPGELVGIGAPVSCYHFVEMLEEEAFRAGAANVYVQWEDRHLREQRILHAQEEMLRSVPTWERSGLDHVVSSGGSLIQVRSPLFEDFPPEAASRASLMQTSDDEANQILMNTKMSFTTPWVILLLPNQRWAKKVYPDLPDEEAYRTLADSLMDCARIQTEGTIQAWDAHCAELKRRADLLAGKNVIFNIQTVNHFWEIRNILDLVQKNVSHSLRIQMLFQIVIQLPVIRQFLIINILKINGYDPAGFHPLFPQPLLIHLQERRFSAPAHSCHNFDQLFITKRNQFLQIFFSLYHHAYSSA